MNRIKLNDFDQRVSASKDTQVYRIHDCVGKYLTQSMTCLHPHQQTRGHEHAGQEEIYIFTAGRGTMTLGNNAFCVEAGDLVSIPDSVFHQVTNPNDEELKFYCVFNGLPARPK